MMCDELDPPRPAMQPLNLQSMSIEDLKNYTQSLHAEIARVEAVIESKQAHLSGAQNLFVR